MSFFGPDSASVGCFGLVAAISGMRDPRLFARAKVSNMAIFPYTADVVLLSIRALIYAMDQNYSDAHKYITNNTHDAEMAILIVFVAPCIALFVIVIIYLAGCLLDDMIRDCMHRTEDEF